MLRTIIAASLVSLGANTAHLDTVCKTALQNPPVFGNGVVSYRLTEESGTHYVLDTFEGKRIFENYQKMRSVVSTSDGYWVLFTGGLLNITKEGTIVSDHEMEKSISMIQVGDLLLVVRNGGMTAFNLKSKTEVWTSFLGEVKGGEPLSLAFDGKNAQVVMTATREGGFNGVATVDISSGKVLKATAYNYKYGVIDPEANAQWYNNQLIINNGGWIHLITNAQLVRGKEIKPRWVALPLGTGMDQHYMMLKGEFFLEGDSVVGCGVYQERINGNLELLTKLFKVKIP